MSDLANIINKNGDELQLMIYSDIGEGGLFFDSIGAQDVINEITQANPSRITVNIKSNGGSVFEGVAIYNYLKSYKGNVKVVVDSIAASIASVIAMAGDTIEMKEGSLMMIHDPMMMAAGNSDEMRKAAELLDKVGGSIADIYKSNNRSNYSKEQIQDLMNKETWMNAKEAVEMGFADKYREGKKSVSNTQLASMVAKYNPPKNIVNQLNNSHKMENNTNIFESFTNFFKQKKEVDNALNEVVEPIKNEYETKLKAEKERAEQLQNSLDGLTKTNTETQEKLTEISNSLEALKAEKEQLEAKIKEAGLPNPTASQSEPNEDVKPASVHPFDAGLLNVFGDGMEKIYNKHKKAK